VCGEFAARCGDSEAREDTAHLAAGIRGPLLFLEGVEVVASFPDGSIKIIAECVEIGTYRMTIVRRCAVS
jgi:hypothetical protein